MSLAQDEVKEILNSCMNKTHEEVLQILHTDKGQELIQDMAKSIFPKNNCMIRSTKENKKGK